MAVQHSVFVLYRKKQTDLIWYLPVVLQWLICLLSPVNGCGRYAYVVYVMTPFIMAVCLESATGAVGSAAKAAKSKAAAAKA